MDCQIKDVINTFRMLVARRPIWIKDDDKLKPFYVSHALGEMEGKHAMLVCKGPYREEHFEQINKEYEQGCSSTGQKGHHKQNWMEHRHVMLCRGYDSYKI